MLQSYNPKNTGYSLIELLIGIAVATVVLIMLILVLQAQQQRARISTMAADMLSLASAVQKKYAEYHGNYAGITNQWINGMGLEPVGWVFVAAGAGNPARWDTGIFRDISVEAGDIPTTDASFNILLKGVSEENCVQLSERIFSHARAIEINGNLFKGQGIGSTVEHLVTNCTGGGEVHYHF